MADPKPAIRLTPGAVVTHQEVTFDFTDLEPDTEYAVNIAGPAAPYWVTLKTDPWGQTQLIWRTQKAGDYTMTAKGLNSKEKISEDFTVARQAGEFVEDEDEEELATGGGAMTVAEPGDMGDTPSGELRADQYDPELDRPEQVDPAFEPAVPISTKEGPAPKPDARRKADSQRKGK